MTNKLIINTQEYGRLGISRSVYTNNGNLAIIAVVADTGLPFGTMTINTDKQLPENFACVDTNNMQFVKEILINAGIAKDTNWSIASGFCIYPVMEFDIDKIPQET